MRFTYVPTDDSIGSRIAKSGNTSVKQARNVLATQLKREGSIRGSQITDARVTSERLIVTDKRGEQSIFKYRELPQISLVAYPTSSNVLLAGKSTFTLTIKDDTVSGYRVMNALYILQQNAIKQKEASDEYDASFAASLADYRKKAASNAALPEEANKYKAQAEGAVRDKEFDDAADFYAAALKIAPWWPAGHFNRALVLGEAGDYELAKREMNYYLQLVPNAPNARAAQDKIYDWARLESK